MSGMLHGGPGDPRPIRGRKASPLNEVRNEMRRLMGILLDLNKSYLEREKYVRGMHARGKQNFSGELVTVLNNDLILGSLSGGAKTVGALVQACSAYILAEQAMRDRTREQVDLDRAEAS